MKFLFITAALLLLSVDARPASFKNDEITKDSDGFIRYDGPAPVSSKRGERSVEAPYLFFEGKVNPDVISFDSDVQEIDTIQCSNDQSVLTFNLTENQSPPSWENGTTIIGGLEWECVNAEGNLVAIAVVIQGPTEQLEGREGFYTVKTKPAEFQDIYSNLTFTVNPPNRKRDESDTKRHNWNKNESTGVANQRFTLGESDCNSQDLSSETREFCQNGGDYRASAVCSNCWMTHDFTLSFSAGCRGLFCSDSYAQLSTLGRVEANLEVELEAQGLFAASKRLAFQIPIVGFNFHVVALQFYLEPALDLSASFEGQGKATFGVETTSSYQGEFGTEAFYTSFSNGELKQSKPYLNANGVASSKIGLNISPSAVVSIASIISASASVTVGPYVQADAVLSVPDLLSPRSSIPNTNVIFPTSEAVCTVPHIAEYNVNFGLEVTAQAQWKALWLGGQNNWDLYKSTHGLTSGCLGAGSNGYSAPSSRNVNLYFPSTSSIGQISSSAFSKLLAQDLTKILGVSFSAFGNITVESKSLFGKYFYVASISFLESDISVGALDAASRLEGIAKDTSQISGMSSSLSVSNQMVNKPAAQVNGQTNGQQNGLASSSSNILPCLSVLVFLSAFI